MTPRSAAPFRLMAELVEGRQLEPAGGVANLGWFRWLGER